MRKSRWVIPVGCTSSVPSGSNTKRELSITGNVSHSYDNRLACPNLCLSKRGGWSLYMGETVEKRATVVTQSGSDTQHLTLIIRWHGHQLLQELWKKIFGSEGLGFKYFISRLNLPADYSKDITLYYSSSIDRITHSTQFQSILLECNIWWIYYFNL